MARLHEYQGKAILAANGFKVPRGCCDLLFPPRGVGLAGA
jgi:hypothetical protein